MFRKLLASVGLGVASITTVTASRPYAPYSTPASNEIYNLLFCDEPKAFEPREGQTTVQWQEVLFASPLNLSAVDALANDPNGEGRIRFLAYSVLRNQGKQVPQKKLLGVIVEVPLAGGLDVLAAFSEGGVRYLNQTGKLAVADGVATLQPLVHSLFAASEPAIARIGPWEKLRLPPPKSGNIRLTFLVSDGLYFGEGPMAAMQREPMAGPIIQAATTLLQAVVDTTIK